MSFPRSSPEFGGMHGSHPVFNRFWRHYDASMEWLRLHLAVMNQVSGEFDSRGAPKRRKFRSEDSTKATNLTEFPEPDEDDRNQETNPEDQTDDSALTEELLNFFEVSRKHREARDKEVAGRNYENLENLMITSRESALNAGSGTSEVFERRLEHLKDLYGSEWMKIHGMEMALQSGFDRFTSHNDARLWPNIPIRIKLNY